MRRRAMQQIGLNVYTIILAKDTDRISFNQKKAEEVDLSKHSIGKQQSCYNRFSQTLSSPKLFITVLIVF